MAIQILQDVALHLLLGRADKIDLHALKLCQQVGQGTRGTSSIEFADKRNAQTIERTLAIDGVQVEQRLRRVLPTISVARIDDRHRRYLGCAGRSAGLMMTNNNYVGVAADDANRIFDLLGLNLRRKCV